MIIQHRLGLFFSSLGGPISLALSLSWLHHDFVVTTTPEFSKVLTQLLCPLVLFLGFVSNNFVIQFRSLTETKALIVDVVILLPCLIEHHFLRRAKVTLLEESHLLKICTT